MFPPKARWLDAWLPRHRRQATASVHSRAGRYGGFRQFLDHLLQHVWRLRASASTAGAHAPRLRHSLQDPAVEGELPGLAVQPHLPQRHVAPRRVLWAAGR